MTTITRFAPSPTGRLHVGNIRTALVCWLAARQVGGQFLLRLDDTDQARSTEAFVEAIREDLGWLGLVPDGEVRQSERFALYESGVRDAARGGPGLSLLRERGGAGDQAPHRARSRVAAALRPRRAQALRRAAAGAGGRGRPPALALQARCASRSHGPIWCAGPQHFEGSALSDPVIRRADGSWLYLLPSVIDDIDMKVSHVVRGEDHVANTAIQIQMFEALSATVPQFAHMALLVGTDGKLSKREGAIGVDAIRAEGIEPQALLALLARIGTSEPVVPVATNAELVAGFAFAHMGRAPARFDPAELAQINARTLHLLSYGAVRNRLPTGMDEAAWLAVRPNCTTLADAADGWSMIEGPIPAPAFDAEDKTFCARAAAIAKTLDWTAEPWAQLTSALKAETGRKGRALFWPLRLALTGRDHGPEMAALLPLIGRDRAIARLGA